jgi:hypothetical protein
MAELKAAVITYNVDVVEVAAAATGIDHLLHPIQAFSRVG